MIHTNIHIFHSVYGEYLFMFGLHWTLIRKFNLETDDLHSSFRGFSFDNKINVTNIRNCLNQHYNVRSDTLFIHNLLDIHRIKSSMCRWQMPSEYIRLNESNVYTMTERHTKILCSSE